MPDDTSLTEEELAAISRRIERYCLGRNDGWAGHGTVYPHDPDYMCGYRDGFRTYAQAATALWAEDEAEKEADDHA